MNHSHASSQIELVPCFGVGSIKLVNLCYSYEHMHETRNINHVAHALPFIMMTSLAKRKQEPRVLVRISFWHHYSSGCLSI